MNETKKDVRKKTGAGAVTGGVVGGVAGGATTGALAGGLGGPAGAAIGAVVGAAVGALAARNAKIDPVAEDNYWRDNYSARPYVATDAAYDDYSPAYRYGSDSYTRYPNRTFDEVEPELRNNWGQARGSSKLDWDNAKHASRDAWTRVSNAVERAVPGDSDGDGR